MIMELVRVSAPDGVRLDGGFWAAEAQLPVDMPIDVALFWHGTGASFYSSSLQDALRDELCGAGIPTLTANTRGHDLVYVGSTSQGPRRLGAAYETVDDCRHDLHAWISHLLSRGYRRVGLFGHSLGGIKAIYAMSQNDRPDAVARICAISPARLSYRQFAAGPRAADFNAQIAAAESHVAAGRGDTLLDVTIPIPYLVSAAGYLDKYGHAERYNILDLLPRISVPTLVTLGTLEVESHDAFRGLPEEIESLAKANRHLKLSVIAGGDHIYAGMRAELAARILAWLRPSKGATRSPGDKKSPAKSNRAASPTSQPVKAKAKAAAKAKSPPAKTRPKASAARGKAGKGKAAKGKRR